MDRFLSFDTETTGLKSDARIVEIGVVLYEGGVEMERWSSLLRPKNVDWDNPDVRKAMEVNQIERSTLETAPELPEVFHWVTYHFGGAEVWVAHNAEFDMRMIKQEMQHHPSLAFPLVPRLCLDTKLLSYRLHPREKSHKLQDVAPRWGVVPDGAHRASSDAATCGRILLAMVSNGAVPVVVSEMEGFHKHAEEMWRRKPKGVW